MMKNIEFGIEAIEWWAKYRDEKHGNFELISYWTSESKNKRNGR